MMHACMLGVIFNRVRVEPPENLKALCEEAFGRILGIIPFDIRFMEAFEERNIFCVEYPETNASKEIRKSAQRMIESLRDKATMEIALDRPSLEEAIASYNRALELNPDLAEAWISKGIALYRLGKFEEAIVCFEKAIELEPNNERAHLWRGKAITYQQA